MLLVLASSAAAEPVTALFTGSDGETIEYRYSLEGLSTSGEPPGLLIYFSSTRSLSLGFFQSTAKEHGLIPVSVAWWGKTYPQVHEFLETGLPSELTFDRNRVVFFGSSSGTNALARLLRAYGTSYGGGFYAWCGADLDVHTFGPSLPWDLPEGFEDRFRIVVQAGFGDFLHDSALRTYLYYKYQIGLDTFGDLSAPGGHCEGGSLSPRQAVGWILRATEIIADEAEDEPERHIPLRTERATERGSIGDSGRRTLASIEKPRCHIGPNDNNGQGPALWVPTSGDAHPQVVEREVGVRGIEVFAGNESPPHLQLGEPANPVELGNSLDVAVDAAGNVYVADNRNHRVVRIDTAGTVTTIAGTGTLTAGSPLRDGVPATEAEIAPRALAVDAAGNAYVVHFTSVVRRIDAVTGVITTIAGIGSGGFSGDGGPATEARLSVSSLAVDGTGNVFLADGWNSRVRRVDAVTGVITTIAGNGEQLYSGDGGPATEAGLNPGGLAVDGDGNVYVVDRSPNYRVRRIDAVTGVITTIAGNGVSATSRSQLYGRPATEAPVNPLGLAVDAAGNIYLGSYDRVRRIDAVTGVITAFAGTSENVDFDGAAVNARIIGSMRSVAVDTAGNVYFAASARGRDDDYPGVFVVPIRDRMTFIEVPLGGDGEIVSFELAESGAVTLCGTQVFAGARVATRDGGIYALDQLATGTIDASQVARSEPIAVAASLAQPGINRISTMVSSGAGLHNPNALTVDSVGNVYVADQGNDRVLQVDTLGVITTVAGTGESGYGGDGAAATEAQLNSPQGLAVDGDGNVYVADEGNGRVRRIDAVTGVITTVAGNGEYRSSADARSSPDGGPATEAAMNPADVAVDAAGNVYVADSYGGRVRRIDAVTGVITAIAGAGTEVVPQLDFPYAVAVDAAGNVYVAGVFNHQVFRISPEGALTATYPFSSPRDLAVDAAGNLYIAGESPRGRVLRIDAAGNRTWVVGTGGDPGHAGDGGPATEATLYHANSVAVDAAGNLYVGDRDRIRFVSMAPFEVGVPLGSSGETAWLSVSAELKVSRHGRPVVAGSRVVDSAGGTYALSLAPSGDLRATWVDKKQVLSLGQGQRPVEFKQGESGAWSIGSRSVRSGYRHVQGGREYLLDVADGRWRVATHAMRTVAGNSSVEDGVLATGTTLYSPSSVAVDTAGNLYLADRENNRVRRIDAAGMVATFAGTGDRGFSGDGGLAVEAQLDRPSAVAVDAAGQVYIADSGNQRIRRVNVGGRIATIAGTGSAGFGGDGMLGTSASLDNPIGLAADAVGNVYVADSGNQRIRRIDLQGIITTVAGTEEPGYGGDGGAATEALLDGPTGVAADTAGNLYVADHRNQRVRRIDAAGVITTIAGTGESGYGGDGAAATEALLDGPTGVAADTAGNLYVADYRNQRVRRIDAAGVITTVAGTGESGYGGDGAAATEALLDGPFGVAALDPGNVYVAELSNHRVRRIGTGGTITTVAGTGEPFHRGDDGSASQAQFSHALGDVAVDVNGNVYVTDSYDHRVRRVDAAGRVATFAGSGTAGFQGDGGPAIEAQLSSPGGVAVDATGNVYVADTWNHRIRKVGESGTITTIAGTGGIGVGREDSTATQTPLHSPKKLAVDADGNVYVLDAGNHRVCVVTPSGRMRTVAGSGDVEGVGFPFVLDFFDGFDARRVPLFGVSHLAVRAVPGGDGKLYLAEFFGGSLLRAVSLGADHRINQIFSDSTRGLVKGLALDADANMYIADDLGIRMRAPDGTLSMIADARENGFSVGAIAVDSSGSIWFTDPVHRRIRVLEPVN